MLNGLYNSIQDIRSNGFDLTMENSRESSSKIDILLGFVEKREHKVHNEWTEKNQTMKVQLQFIIKLKMIFALLLTQLF